MIRDRLDEIRSQYTVAGKLDVAPDDPRLKTAIMTALDYDAAERGFAGATFAPVLTEAKRLRDLYRQRLAEARASSFALAAWALAIGFAFGFGLGVFVVKAGVV